MDNVFDTVVVIRFGDNDFYNAVTNFLRSLAGALNDRSPFVTGDKEKALKIVNDSLYAFYRIHQNQYEYNDGGNEHMKQYLQITSDHLFLGDDAKQIANSAEWDNHETFVLDMRLPDSDSNRHRVYSL